MLSTLVLAAQLAASPMTFAEAKAQALRTHAAMRTPAREALFDTQGRTLVAALDSCGSPGNDLSSFTVVLRLRADGSAARSWREGESPLARCVERHLVEVGVPGRWPEPFYIAIGAQLRAP
ncbi:hypothetical protein [Lysobacter xanthus]